MLNFHVGHFKTWIFFCMFCSTSNLWKLGLKCSVWKLAHSRRTKGRGILYIVLLKHFLWSSFPQQCLFLSKKNIWRSFRWHWWRRERERYEGGHYFRSWQSLEQHFTQMHIVHKLHCIAIRWFDWCLLQNWIALEWMSVSTRLSISTRWKYFLFRLKRKEKVKRGHSWN